jgi:hypothetical protein
LKYFEDYIQKRLVPLIKELAVDEEPMPLLSLKLIYIALVND